jgi:hypothetical protein
MLYLFAKKNFSNSFFFRLSQKHENWDIRFWYDNIDLSNMGFFRSAVMVIVKCTSIIIICNTLQLHFNILRATWATNSFSIDLKWYRSVDNSSLIIEHIENATFQVVSSGRVYKQLHRPAERASGSRLVFWIHLQKEAVHLPCYCALWWVKYIVRSTLRVLHII